MIASQITSKCNVLKILHNPKYISLNYDFQIFCLSVLNIIILYYEFKFKYIYILCQISGVIENILWG